MNEIEVGLISFITGFYCINIRIKSLQSHLERFSNNNILSRFEGTISISFDDIMLFCITDIDCISIICYIRKTVGSTADSISYISLHDNFHNLSTRNITVRTKSIVGISLYYSMIIEILDAFTILMTRDILGRKRKRASS